MTDRIEISDARKAEVANRYRDGQTIEQIAFACSIVARKVGAILAELGVPRRHGGSPVIIDRDVVCSLWNNGLCATQIAERLGVGSAGVWGVLRSAGLTNQQTKRTRYDSATPGGSGRSGFRGNMARRV